MLFMSNSGFSAAQNMAIDNELVEQALKQSENNPLEPVYRFYEWKAPASVTYTAGKALPAPLRDLSSSERVTGGGIVFHCPGDIVFCVILPLSDPWFPTGVKPKMAYLSGLIQKALHSVGVVTHHRTDSQSRNILFCNSYPNPYELFVEDEKCCAIAMRKFRHMVIMQGVIHLKRSEDHFKSWGDTYGEYFTGGISQPVDATKLIAILYQQLNV